MSKLLALHLCNSASDVARLIGFQPKAIGYLAWGTKARYTTFEIPKRSGGKRTINAPILHLKIAQRKLADLLQECESEIEEAIGVKQRVSHGFRRDHCILTNASVHRGKRYVLNLDLEDFFGTINFGRVRGYFITNKHFQLKADVATLLAQLACHDSKLPQGAPTSPVISNLIGNILDIRLLKLARAHGCSYTRYADDITISTSAPTFPVEIALEGPTNTWTLSKTLNDSVKSSGFAVNAKKTRLLHRRSRQDVTGIVVNKCLNVNSDYQRRVRVMVHHLRSTGKFYRKLSSLTAAGDTEVQSRDGTRAQLQGMLGFVMHVERFRRGDEPLPEKLTGIEKLYRRFLFYTQFANHEMPVLLFEGKTDTIYLGAAIRALAPAYPTLIAASALQVHMLRNTPRIERLFGLRGGGDQLFNFVGEYHEEYRHIQGPKGTRPVIVVVDNDAIGRNMVKKVEGMTKTTIPVGSQWFRVQDNLYVVLTSPFDPKGAMHCIEACFDPKFMATALGGKTLSKGSKGKKLDPAKEVSKAWFAEKIVKPNTKSISFAGFSSLLDCISDVITKHVP
ncbi:retron Ec67 family RNA-directed DNA polymerase/endonuclease [Luteimonas sp. Y-2-2-4F]|nr:retron Ec67 family RNA-directed DNA polymerase/endonuclease [Luteimonas sp. Y-2-2-4F]MCD9033242.1 retron Ec67 family RNA-directed DNA polymerase/endonuclease [Luteimonas sp. Y-2-2-4F]